MIGHYETYEKYETALKKRLQSLKDVFNRIESGKDKLPQNYRFLGFPMMKVKSKEEIKIRIKELSECLHVEKPTIKTETERYTKEEMI